jgi:hypothetical protein
MTALGYFPGRVTHRKSGVPLTRIVIKPEANAGEARLAACDRIVTKGKANVLKLIHLKSSWFSATATAFLGVSICKIIQSKDTASEDNWFQFPSPAAVN